MIKIVRMNFCVAQAAILIIGSIINIIVASSSMLDMLTMFIFNELAGACSIIAFTLYRKKKAIFPLACNILLIASIAANFLRIRHDNLGYVLFYNNVLEYGYYILLSIMLILNIIFSFVYIRNLIKGRQL